MNRTLNCKAPVMILSLLALVFSLLKSSIFFVLQVGNYIAICLPPVGVLLYCIASLLPYILLLLYVFLLHRTKGAKAWCATVFGLVALLSLAELLLRINGYFFNWTDAFFNRYITGSIRDLMIIVPFALAAVSAGRGFPRVTFLIVAVVAGVFSVFVAMAFIAPQILTLIEEKMYLKLAAQLAQVWASIALYVGLFVLGITNRATLEKR